MGAEEQALLARRSSVRQEIGRSSPLGATVCGEGVNLSVFSRNASRVDLLLFDHKDDRHPSRVVPRDSPLNRTYDYWHVFVPRPGAGQIYTYRIYGEFNASGGLRYDANKLLLGPYGRGVVVPGDYSRETARKPGTDTAAAMRSVVVDPSKYDWEGDFRLKTPSAGSIIYEMHLKGFTQHPSSSIPENLRAHIVLLTTSGLQFQARPRGPGGRISRHGQALHRASIEVILDVVYNHSAQGGQDGAPLSSRGFDNLTYYILKKTGRAIPITAAVGTR